MRLTSPAQGDERDSDEHDRIVTGYRERGVADLDENDH